jgi:mono/diheme cytochrome c family protein
MTTRVSLVALLLIVGCSDAEAEKPLADASRDGSRDASSVPDRDGGSGGSGGAKDAGHHPAEASAPTDAGPGYPPLLSETGLFADIASETLGPGVRPFQPQYVLWSDGATKRRWVFLPDGAKIDTSDMDFWRFPVGTKVWKEFTVDNKRIETRMLHKAGPDPADWVMIAYAWKDDRSDAVATPAGIQNAMGTPHDIPPQDACQFCHGNMKDRLLGFSALQLSHDLPGVTLSTLMQEGRLTDPPAAPFTLPGDAVARTALGYLHANCGDCHNPSSGVFASVDMQLWESTKTLDTVFDTTAYRTAVDEPTPGAAVDRIVPGHPERSMVYVRMDTRGNGQMPPLATEIVDTTGLAHIGDWIRALASGDGGAGDASVGDASVGDAATEGGSTARD